MSYITRGVVVAIHLTLNLELLPVALIEIVFSPHVTVVTVSKMN